MIYRLINNISEFLRIVNINFRMKFIENIVNMTLFIYDILTSKYKHEESNITNRYNENFRRFIIHQQMSTQMRGILREYLLASTSISSVQRPSEYVPRFSMRIFNSQPFNIDYSSRIYLINQFNRTDVPTRSNRYANAIIAANNNIRARRTVFAGSFESRFPVIDEPTDEARLDEQFMNNIVGDGDRVYVRYMFNRNNDLDEAARVTLNGVARLRVNMTNISEIMGIFSCTCGICIPSPKFKTMVKAIDKNKNTECPITYDTIEQNQEYLCCDECRYNFTVDAVLKYWKSNSNIRKCPMCRSKWTDYCKYINIDIDLKEKKELEKKLKEELEEKKYKKFHNKKLVKSLIEDDNKNKLTNSRYNKRYNYAR